MTTSNGSATSEYWAANRPSRDFGGAGVAIAAAGRSAFRLSVMSGIPVAREHRVKPGKEFVMALGAVAFYRVARVKTARILRMIPNSSLGLDMDLGDTVDMLRDTVRSFTSDHIAPMAEEIDRSNTFPRQLWPQLGELGLLGITVEEEWGGAGLGYLAHCVAMEEISRGSASIGLSYGAHSNLCVNQIKRNASAEQKLRY